MIDSGKYAFAKHEKTLSATRIITYMDCNLKWWFRYVKGVKTEKKYYLTRGSIFHEVAALLLEDPEKPVEYYQDKAKEIFAEFKMRGEPVGDEKFSEERVLNLILAAINRFYAYTKARPGFRLLTYQDPLNSPRPCAEVPFKIPFVNLDTMQLIPGIDRDLFGFIDEISWDEEWQVTIRDHKLHSNRPTPFELDMDIQLHLYAYVFKFLWQMGCFPELRNANMESFTVGLNSCLVNRNKNDVGMKFVTATVDNKKIQGTLNLIAEMYQNMNEANPVPSYHGDCNWKCDYKEVCALKRRGEDIDGWITSNNARLANVDEDDLDPSPLFTRIKKRTLFEL